MQHTGEQAVAGRTDGLIELRETVTWEARHLMMTQRMTVAITAMDRPGHFRDEQTAGPFKSFTHDHTFKSLSEAVTQMIDTITFESPMGVIGRCVDRVYLSRYLTRLIAQRGVLLRDVAEEQFRG